MSDFSILIPLAGISLGAFAVWTGHVRKLASIKAKSSQTKPEDMRRVADLENRVQVLERIVTDGSYDTAREIEALRDTPRLSSEPPPRSAGDISRLRQNKKEEA